MYYIFWRHITTANQLNDVTKKNMKPLKCM
jgi:hypothetical protein